MRKNDFKSMTVNLIFSQVLVLLILMATVIAFSQEIKIDAPQWNYGDTWTYKYESGREGTLAIIDIRDDFYIGRWRGSRFENYYDKDLVLVKQVNLIDKTERTKGDIIGKKLLNFPLYTGKKWKFTFDGHPGGDVTREIRYENNLKVVGWEDIQVPAGKFMAFKIEWKQEALFVRWQQTQFRWYMWYVPEVKNIVKRLAPVGTDGKIQDYELIFYQVKQ